MLMQICLANGSEYFALIGVGWLMAAMVAVTGLCLIAWRGSWFRLGRASVEAGASEATADTQTHSRAAPQHQYGEDLPPLDEPLDETAQLVQNMLAQGRYALLLRPQISANLSPNQRLRAENALDSNMAIVPQGEVMLHSWRHEKKSRDDDQGGPKERLVRVDAIYLDRYPVTNRLYQQFVDHGGYEQQQLWDPAILPAVLDFVDQTGHQGPRYWSDGHFPEGHGDHPVVGISWYEASAFARWAGKRLPSDPEWVKAGCWPVLTQGTKPAQRKFPWGDAMDRALANLWGGAGTTVSVYEHPDGVSVGGVYQLIGNVWEWTTSQFGAWDATGRRMELPAPMKSIRGGAFDTYFDTQATCQFQSGDSPLARKPNIGFRCALAMCDVAPVEEPNLENDAELVDSQQMQEETV